MSDTKPLEVKDWLDEQEFFEYCQRYRYAGPTGEDAQSTMEAFEALKKYIRDQINVVSAIEG